MLMIFLFHVHLFSGGGTLGVSFFFVLSGFSLTIGYRERIIYGQFSHRSFLYKRLVRFFPIHWLTLLLATILGYKSFMYLIPQFITNFFLMQSWVPIQEYYLSFNSVSWYLSDTLFFVLIFPLLIKYTHLVSHIIQIIVGSLVFVGYVVLLFVLPEELYSPVLYVNPLVRLIDFLIGIYTAIYVNRIIKAKYERVTTFFNNNKGIVVLFMVILIVVLIVVSLSVDYSVRKFSVIYWPIIVLLLVCAALLGSRDSDNLFRAKPLVWLGEISFTFYMIHQLVIIYIDAFFHVVHYEGNVYIIALLSFVLSILGAIILERYFVKPINNRMLNDRLVKK